MVDALEIGRTLFDDLTGTYREGITVILQVNRDKTIKVRELDGSTSENPEIIDVKHSMPKESESDFLARFRKDYLGRNQMNLFSYTIGQGGSPAKAVFPEASAPRG